MAIIRLGWLEVLHFLFVSSGCMCLYTRTDNCSAHQLIHYKEPCNKDIHENALFWIGVRNVIRRLKWKSFAFVFDNVPGAEICYCVWLDLEHQQWLTQTYQFKGDNPARLLNDIHSMLYPDINIVMCCNYNKSPVIKTAESLDAKSNRTTDYRHHSKWLIIHVNETSCTLSTPPELDNIAVITAALSPEQNFKTGNRGIRMYTKQAVKGEVKFSRVSTFSKDSVFPNLKYGYNNRTLEVALVPYPPYVYKENYSANGRPRYYGYSIDIVHALAKTLNFSYVIVEPSDQEWGEYINGTWNGMVGQLQRREVDFAASDLTIYSERAKVMDFILPQIQAERIDVIYQKVDNSESNWTMLFDFISIEAFLFLVMCILTFPLLYVLVEITNQRGYNVGIGDFLNKKTFTEKMDVWWFTIGSVLKQGGDMRPRSCANRMLLSFWWIFVIVVTATFSAHIIANLSVKKGKQPFSSLAELLANREYTVGSMIGGITATILENSTRDDVQLLLKTLKDRNDSLGFSQDFNLHLQRLKTSKYATVAYDSVYGMFLTKQCSLQRLGADINYEPIAFGIPKRSPMKHDLEKAMESLLESGLMEEWWRRWSHKSYDKCHKKKKSANTYSKIHLDQIGGGFVIVSSGILFAGVILFLEIMFRKIRR